MPPMTRMRPIEGDVRHSAESHRVCHCVATALCTQFSNKVCAALLHSKKSILR